MATEVIERVGPGGNYLTQRHTLDHIRGDEYYLPATANRMSRESWEQAGGLDARERARKIAREILIRERSDLIPPEVDEQIRARFDIVAPKRAAR